MEIKQYVALLCFPTAQANPFVLQPLLRAKMLQQQLQLVSIVWIQKHINSLWCKHHALIKCSRAQSACEFDKGNSGLMRLTMTACINVCIVRRTDICTHWSEAMPLMHSHLPMICQSAPNGWTWSQLLATCNIPRSYLNRSHCQHQP